MVYLILAGLVLVLILAVNLANVDPMPLDMEDEDERLRAYRPKAQGERFADRDPDALQRKAWRGRA